MTAPAAAHLVTRDPTVKDNVAGQTSGTITNSTRI
jgi:hypothetical protein